MTNKQTVKFDDDDLGFLRDRLIAKIKNCKEADKLIAFLLIVDMSDKDLVDVAGGLRKAKKGWQND